MLDIKDIPFASHARACVDGEWLVILDLRGDRYWALPRPGSLEAVAPALSARGLLATVGSRSSGAAFSRSVWPAWLALIEAAIWADSIVRSGRLDRAFSWISRRSASAPKPEASGVTGIYDRFDRMRIWIPHDYVCLFNSLCLIRFMLRRGAGANLVFGVRARPFAAHCWVEAGGRILDDGGEDCATFTEIARV
jgi:hypothetical protein